MVRGKDRYNGNSKGALRKNFLCFSQFSSCLQSFSVQHTLLNNLCPTRLNCKIVLCKRNLFLSAIPILCYQIAGVAG